MNKNDIITSLKKHIENNTKIPYYKQCVDEIKKLPTIITKIYKHPEILESIRLHLCYNPEKYNLYLYNKIKKDCSYIRYILDETSYKNLIHQLLTIKKTNDIIGLAYIDENDYPELNLKKTKHCYIVFLLISPKDNNVEFKQKNNVFEIKNIYESFCYLFGIDTFRLLKHQRIDRIVNFIKKGGESYQIYKLMDDYLKYLQQMNWQQRDKILIHSSSIYQALGTTYTRDLDLMILQENNDYKSALNTIKDLENTKLDIDPSVLINTGDWVLPKGKVMKYKSIWLTQLLPNTVGAENIFETIANPTYNLFFMGMRFISIQMNIEKFLSRSNPNTFIDLIMLEELNNINIGKKMCVPNMTIRQGKLVVFDDKHIENIHNIIKVKLKEYYNKDYDIDKIKKRIKKCVNEGYEIYKGPIIKDPDTNIVKSFHLSVKEEIFKKYISNIDYLLDVGAGQLTDLRFWNKSNIKNIYAVEPSVHSIKKAYERIEKFGAIMNLQIINSVGDVDWMEDEKFKEISKHKYDVITYQYTFHYMIHNIELMLKNMKNLLKPRGKVVILCMDGNKINNVFNKFGKVEIRNSSEPIFAVVPMYDIKQEKQFDNNDILVYFKGAYGVANGSIEKIIDIDKLVKKFADNDFKLLERKRFVEYDLPIKQKMHSNQRELSSYYVSLIFQYK